MEQNPATSFQYRPPINKFQSGQFNASPSKLDASGTVQVEPWHRGQTGFPHFYSEFSGSSVVRCWTTDQKVVCSNLCGPFSMAHIPQLLSCVNETFVSRSG